MDIQTCTKYTEFLTNECNKKLQDGKITCEELIELSNAIKRFKEKVKESDIPTDLKNKISEIDFEYSSKKEARKEKIIFVAILTFGIGAYLYNYRQYSKRKNAVLELKSKISPLPTFIKMNY